MGCISLPTFIEHCCLSQRSVRPYPNSEILLYIMCKKKSHSCRKRLPMYAFVDSLMNAIPPSQALGMGTQSLTSSASIQESHIRPCSLWHALVLMLKHMLHVFSLWVAVRLDFHREFQGQQERRLTFDTRPEFPTSLPPANEGRHEVCGKQASAQRSVVEIPCRPLGQECVLTFLL